MGFPLPPAHAPLAPHSFPSPARRQADRPLSQSYDRNRVLSSISILFIYLLLLLLLLLLLCLFQVPAGKKKSHTPFPHHHYHYYNITSHLFSLLLPLLLLLLLPLLLFVKSHTLLARSLLLSPLFFFLLLAIHSPITHSVNPKKDNRETHTSKASLYPSLPSLFFS
jgi:hypothetical protein